MNPVSVVAVSSNPHRDQTYQPDFASGMFGISLVIGMIIMLVMMYRGTKR